MKAVPQAAKWLGALGAIPFIVFATSSIMFDGLLQAQAWFALVAYGAVILSFLGGIHWGLAIAEYGTRLDRKPWRRLLISVVPSLIGWTALMMPSVPGLLLMTAAFALMLWIDVTASKQSETPPWYPSLRWPLTLVVMSSLIVGALF